MCIGIEKGIRKLSGEMAILYLDKALGYIDIYLSKFITWYT